MSSMTSTTLPSRFYKNPKSAITAIGEGALGAMYGVLQFGCHYTVCYDRKLDCIDCFNADNKILTYDRYVTLFTVENYWGWLVDEKSMNERYEEYRNSVYYQNAVRRGVEKLEKFFRESA